MFESFIYIQTNHYTNSFMHAFSLSHLRWQLPPGRSLYNFVRKQTAKQEFTEHLSPFILTKKDPFPKERIWKLVVFNRSTQPFDQAAAVVAVAAAAMDSDSEMALDSEMEADSM